MVKEVKRIPSLTRNEFDLVADYAETQGLDEESLTKGFESYLGANSVVFERRTHSSEALAAAGLTVVAASAFQRLFNEYLAQG